MGLRKRMSRRQLPCSVKKAHELSSGQHLGPFTDSSHLQRSVNIYWGDAQHISVESKKIQVGEYSGGHLPHFQKRKERFPSPESVLVPIFELKRDVLQP